MNSEADNALALAETGEQIEISPNLARYMQLEIQTEDSDDGQ
jgi:hypothetical protein